MRTISYLHGILCLWHTHAHMPVFFSRAHNVYTKSPQGDIWLTSTSMLGMVIIFVFHSYIVCLELFREFEVMVVEVAGRVVRSSFLVKLRRKLSNKETWECP